MFQNDFDDRKLVMTYSGGMVKHLGLQMYSGVVNAIAELIANAWDADAPRVDVYVPFDDDWDNPYTEFRVRDYGVGMTFEECNEKFLLVGRDRRESLGTDRTLSGRKVMGRKGIGKLACFGIAKRMEIRTIKNRHLIHFAMDYDAIVGTNSNEFVKTGYEPEILDDRETDENSGTEVILKILDVNKRQSSEQFRLSMARRFSVLSDDFKVFINDELLKRSEIPFQFRYPPEKDKWHTDNVAGVGRVKWWAGFTKTPISDDSARGFVVLAQGKMAQAPFFFDLSGGAGGQLGMQYLTGEVLADGLDDDNTDVIATDRASIRWESPKAYPLLEWGQQKVRQLLNEWVAERTKDKIDNLRERLGDNKWSRINNFPPTEQKEIMRAIRTFANVPTMTDERFAEIVDLLLRAYEDQNFMGMIRQLNKMDLGDQSEFFEFMAEVNILEAVKTASIVQARVIVVKQLKKLIDEKAPEKLSSAPMDMHTMLRDNPWLIDPGWNTLGYEQQLDTMLVERYSIEPTETISGTGQRRFDFFCIRDSQQIVVVEVKRPGYLAGRNEIRQVEDYVNHFKHQIRRGDLTGTNVSGYLIIGKIRDEDIEYRDTAKLHGIETVTWNEVWQRSLSLYGDFLDLVKSKAPKDDPRIQALDNLEE